MLKSGRSIARIATSAKILSPLALAYDIIGGDEKERERDMHECGCT
jgi:hypothetical protein